MTQYCKRVIIIFYIVVLSFIFDKQASLHTLLKRSQQKTAQLHNWQKSDSAEWIVLSQKIV